FIPGCRLTTNSQPTRCKRAPDGARNGMQLSMPSKLRGKFRGGPSEPEHSGAGRRIASILLSAATIFLVIEVALQIQSEILIGESVFDVFTHQTRYVTDERTGLKLLRLNHVVPGTKLTTRANSLGLRSPEILPVRTAGSLRIAVVGASTVMGVKAATN